MSFSPGQIITAQRLNRLQTKTYFSMSSGAITGSSTGNVAGTAQSVTIETDGASFTCSWTAAVYATAGMAGNSNTFAKYDLASSGAFAVGRWSAANEQGTVANFWGGTIGSAGTYTFQVGYSNNVNAQLAIYTSLLTAVMEVA